MEAWSTAHGLSYLQIAALFVALAGGYLAGLPASALDDDVTPLKAATQTLLSFSGIAAGVLLATALALFLWKAHAQLDPVEVLLTTAASIAAVAIYSAILVITRRRRSTTEDPSDTA